MYCTNVAGSPVRAAGGYDTAIGLCGSGPLQNKQKGTASTLAARSRLPTQNPNPMFLLRVFRGIPMHHPSRFGWLFIFIPPERENWCRTKFAPVTVVPPRERSSSVSHVQLYSCQGNCKYDTMLLRVRLCVFYLFPAVISCAVAPGGDRGKHTERYGVVISGFFGIPHGLPGTTLGGGMSCVFEIVPWQTKRKLCSRSRFAVPAVCSLFVDTTLAHLSGRVSRKKKTPLPAQLSRRA